MKLAPAVLCMVLLAGGVGILISLRHHALEEAREVRGEIKVESEKHKVSKEMLRSAESRESQHAYLFHTPASDGKIYDLKDELKNGPVVILFIKEGCPCSVAAETHFNDLHAAYRGFVRFFGVYDGERDDAVAWASRNAVAFPLLLDPDGLLVREFHATNSAYFALVDTEGRIDSFWPGYSSAMLETVNARIARLSGRPEPEIDTSQAPDELYSGCPFLIDSSPEDRGAANDSSAD